MPRKVEKRGFGMNVVLSQYDGDYFSVQFTDGFSSEGVIVNSCG